MSEGLLYTKLHIPPRGRKLVPRPRLTRMLDEGLRPGCRLVLVSAPPGSGKTTLVTDWIHSSKLTPAPLVTWLSLDDGDNDAVRFLAYVVAALQRFEAGLGEDALAALQSPQPPPLEAVLTALLNELAALSEQPSRDPAQSFALTLDDYHVIRAPPVHHILSFLLEHLPLHLHVVLATRADPPVPLSRLRSRGMMIEIRAEDLRFQPQETTALLNEVLGLHLSEQDIARLETRTEGWAAGLQLAALALRPMLAAEEAPESLEVKPASAFIQAFSGDDRFVVDYLVEEVLQHQSEPIQAFLLQTSILERLYGPLCATVTGQAGAQAILEHLERDNMFVVPLDRRRQWYRYHHLFSDLLRHRLLQGDSRIVTSLHQRASQWFQANGFPTEAVQHSIAAEDFEQAARLIEERAWTLMSLGESATYLGWLEALPADIVSSRPRLELVHAWALIAMMQLDAIEPRLREIEKRLTARKTASPKDGETQTAECQALEGEIAALRATVAGMRGDVEAVARHARTALAQLPKEEQLLRGVLSNALGTAYQSQGDAVAASQAFREAAEMSRAAGNTLIALIALGNLSREQEVQGKLRQAADTCLEALDLAIAPERSVHSAAKSRASPAVGMAYVELGRLSYEWNDLDAATKNLETGIDIGKRSGIVELEVSGHVAMVPAFQAQEDMRSAHQAMWKAQQLATTYEASVGLASQISICRARLWLAEGNLEAVARWTAELGLSAEDEWHPQRQAEQVVLARLRIAKQQPEGALLLLDRLLRAAQAQLRTGHAIQLLVLKALAHRMIGDVSVAVAVLGQALLLAEPQGYVRTFLDEGGPMLDLLTEAAARGIAPAYVRSLTAAFGAGQQAAMREIPTQHSGRGLAEPLSERELEVLRLVASGLSNKEIAQELVVTVGTAKWHLNNIYGKLDVHSRTQATARARELGLL